MVRLNNQCPRGSVGFKLRVAQRTPNGEGVELFVVA